jgi:hypothetical protein
LAVILEEDLLLSFDTLPPEYPFPENPYPLSSRCSVPAVVFLVVIPEGDLLLSLSLPLPLFVLAVILSAATDPGTFHPTRTARTFPPLLRFLTPDP